MGLREFFLWQLEHEAATSRRLIERIPEGHNHWRPHRQSMDLGRLSALVASIPGWVECMVRKKEVDLSDLDHDLQRAKAANTRAELCRMLADGLDRSRRALEQATEEDLTHMSRFRRNGRVVSEGPRYVMISDGAISHLAHHRGQLTVYLSLLGEKVPELFPPPGGEFLA
jgi:uncharacterized damage-inducible protein DinB